MPSTTESANDSVGATTSTVPILETNTASSPITNLNLISLENNHHNHQQALANNLTNGLMTNHNLSDESIPYLSDKLNNQNNTLINSNNLTNNLLVTPPEQPSHYTYLKEFRVEQCPLFVQHKCTQHKPFTCFHWHFQNQRRRRPIRKKDGTFNYSPDNYCTKYDETTGICENGDECTLLHRTAGDTERRYHLRYYKTGICVYDTDSRGFCAKNGAHCAFAHGQNDLRNPLYDIHEMTIHNSSLDDQENGNMMNGFSTSLDKDRSAMNEDPRWQDSAFVLSNYKTELCKKPPRLCRQGYACPQYHNSKDKRRTPKSFKYRSTPCPSVKQGDEWGDPMHCEAGDSCHYCHTRTEQQFHPEIYKSTKCNDIQNSQFCPRGPFCAFAHTEQEMNAERELSLETSELANMLNNACNAYASSGGALNTNQTANINAALDKSILNASTNSNSSQNGISPLVNRQQQFNSNQGLNQLNQFQSSNSISISGSGQQPPPGSNGGAFMPSSVPTHFAFNELAASMGLSHRSQPTSGLGAFRRENSPPMLNNNSHNSNNLGPIARPRSYSSSHTSNLHHNLINRENLINSYLKHAIDEKTATAAMNGLNQQNVLPMRKVSTPSTLFAAGPNQQPFGLSANLVNTSSSSHLASSMQNSSANQFFQNLDSTSTTVESVVHSLALDDLTIDDVEDSIEKEMLNQNLASSSLHEEQQHALLHQAGGNPVNLVRSSSNLMANNGPSSTQPVNIPGANQRADIGNLNSPMMNFGQSPLSAASHNVSSSVGSSLYDFASHSGMSPTNAAHHQNALNMLQQNQQVMLMNEIHRLRDELTKTKNKGIKYEEELIKAKNEVQFWKNEALKHEVKIEENEMERRRNQ